MKKPTVTLSAFLALGVLSMSSLRADYTVPIADPPFSLGKSIIGIEGWEHRVDAHKNEDAARLARVRWDEGRPAIILSGASIKNDFPKTEGSKARVSLRVAFLFPQANIELQQFRLLIGGAPFPEIVFQSNKDGGLGIGDGTGRKMDVLVPYSEVKSRSYYTLTVLVDYDQMAYDVTISGVKADGSPLNFERKGVGFESTNPGMQGMAIITANSVRSYISQLSIESL